jgi:hypothetical protein
LIFGVLDFARRSRAFLLQTSQSLQITLCGIMIGPSLHNLRLDGQHFLPIAATLDGARIGLRAAYLG